jgi:protein TonB
MQALLRRGGEELRNIQRRYVVDFVRLKKDSEPEPKQRRLPPLQEAEMPPPLPQIDITRPETRKSLDPHLARSTLDLGLELAGRPSLGGMAAADADAAPLVRVEPRYPVLAARRGIEGHVVVEFTITAAGSVKDASVRESEPPNVFDRAALEAVRKWKYQPKIVDGAAVERSGVKVRLTFELVD